MVRACLPGVLAIIGALCGFFNDALRALTRLGNKQGMATVLNNIAILEAEQGLYEQAIRDLQASTRN